MHVHGSCHCGLVRYEADVDPARTAICHCVDCQRLTGTAYRVSVPALEGTFRITRGSPSVYVKLGDSGARRAQGFCDTCGSPLYSCDADNPTVYGLRTGCIAEREALVPQRQKWCRSALAWTRSLDGLARQEKE
jgi:hypothetical protein